MPSLRDSFGFSVRGLQSAWTERSARVELAIGTAVIAIAALAGFSAGELAVLLCAGLAVLAFEAVNTAVEDTLDLLHPAQDPRVARIKDMMAGSVLLAVLAALVVLVLVLAHHPW